MKKGGEDFFLTKKKGARTFFSAPILSLVYHPHSNAKFIENIYWMQTIIIKLPLSILTFKTNYHYHFIWQWYAFFFIEEQFYKNIEA